MHLEAVFKRVSRCIWRPRSSNPEMHLEAENMLNSVMHLEVVIERDWGCVWRPRWCDYEMHLEAVIERVRRSTWRPSLREIEEVHASGR